ncbi:uncharacterized protein [Choristoneura fumiferana]|uniref:uncharacterized protein n=1 Tax=Choristoneura fumiferana TaxID=7141 RepID=UPI003D15DABF
MLRPLCLVMLAALTRAAIVADPPTLSERLNQLYEKLEKFTPTRPTENVVPERLIKLYEKVERLAAPQTERPLEKILEKLDRLNSLTPEKNFPDDDEELLDAMQEWGMSDEQMDILMKMQRRPYGEEYGDWTEEDQDLTDDDYAMDGSEDMDPEDEESHDPQGSLGSTTTKILKMALALNRLEPEAVAALDPIEATKERPRILDDNGLTKMERAQLRREAYAHIATVLKTSKCLLPQPRWLSVRQLAPSADTHYLPPCVKLHRCAPDSGCCSEANICAPIDGHYVTIPLILDKVGNLKTVARMQFFNHTRCECVSRESLESPRARQHRRGTTAPPPTSTHATPRVTVQGAVGNPRLMDLTTQEPKPDNESTAPPQLRRCTCPTLFMARVSDAGCACVCDWADPARSRDCLSLARGREHFGLRDRVCVAHGSCSPPVCAFGTYEKNLGRCPLRSMQTGGSEAVFDHPGEGMRTVTNLKLDP